MFNWLEKIRNSDEKTKKQWLIILSAVSMLVIVSGWLVYMKSDIQNIGAPEETEIGFWSVFKNGAKTMFGSAKEKISGFIYGISTKMSQIGGENKIIIENPK